MNFDEIFSQLDVFFSELSNESRRVFHGRGGCYEGLQWCCIDFFSPVLVCTFFSEPPVLFLPALKDYLLRCMRGKISSVIVKHRYAGQYEHEVLLGELPNTLFARRQQLKFALDLSVQNIGYFLDMEPGREWLEQRVAGKRLLNLFSYTCSFSVLAIDAGAKKVVNVDMSKGVLSRGRENHRLNGQSTEAVNFLPLNILKSWSRIRKSGPFDIVIIDPPSFQKGSFIAQKDYEKLIRRIPEWVEGKIDILACLNAPMLDESFLIKLFEQELGSASFVGSLPANPDFPDVNSAAALKLLHFSLG